MKLPIFLSLFVSGVALIHAQQIGIEQDLSIVPMPAGNLIAWYGHVGRSYFIQISDPTDHLKKWEWYNIIEGGNDGEISHEVGGVSDKGFFRLQYTNQVPGLGKTLDTADFDGDGISNKDEIEPGATLAQTDPLNPDTDGDGIPDGIERLYGLNAVDSSDAALDSDGDGVSNINEANNHTDPTDPNNTPVEKFFWLNTKITSGLDGLDRQDITNCGLGFDLIQDALDEGKLVYHYFTVESCLPNSTNTTANHTTIPDGPHTKPMFDKLWMSDNVGNTVPPYGEFPLAVDNPNLYQYGWTTEPSSICVASTCWGRYTYDLLLDPNYSINYHYDGFSSNRSKVKLASSFIQDSDRTLSFLKVETRTPLATYSIPYPTTEVLRTAVVEVVIPKGKNVSHTPTIDGHDVGEGDDVGVFKTTLADETKENTVKVDLALVDIEPDDNMAGVVGDVVEPVNPASKTKHFVSPKTTIDLPQEYVLLKATGITAEQITPGNTNQIVEWNGGEAVPNEPLKRRVKRGTAAKNEVKIQVKPAGAVAVQMDVWVVWADVTPIAGTASFCNFIGGATYEVSSQPDKGWRFVFKIQPESILDQATLERPKLSGVKRRSPPGAGKTYTIIPSLGNGDSATKQWDVSRQYQLTIRNPDIPKADLQQGNVAAAWIINQPAAVDTPISFPTSDVEGNDDPVLSNGDEDVNPYAVRSDDPRFNHQFGELSSYDAPILRVLDTWGAAGRSYSVEFNFKEFARVELWDGKRTTGQFWFRLSDHIKWHHYLDTTDDGAASQWKNVSSSSGINHPKP